ncbi:MAG: YkgJ family cysteine cluster protein [Sulfuricellaceae bacterium]|nr:YkgJ family cysteine cluster protein [Sulfuricellaceae bacterium]
MNEQEFQNLAKDSPFQDSPVMPNMLEGDTSIQFRCHRNVKCWNACCSNIDIPLTPYDILRLKNRLKISSAEFLQEYTFPFEMDKDGLPGVKYKPVDGGSACRFMVEEGCSVYEDRPSACRYYPVALLSMRRSDEYTDRTGYALVQEAHCLGHQEDRKITIEDYRTEQGVNDFDEKSRGWRQLILKKKSAGPAIGKPQQMSNQLFFMASYDLDRFRAFVMSPSFNESYVIAVETMAELVADDEKLMAFGFDFLRHALFNEKNLEERDGAYDKHRARLNERAQKIRAGFEQDREKLEELKYSPDARPGDCECGGNE